MNSLARMLCCLAVLALPVSAADQHNATEEQVAGRAEGTAEPDAEVLTRWHCEGVHRPAHCGNVTLNTTVGNFSASYALDGGASARPLHVAGGGTLQILVVLDGVAGAEANVRISVEDAAGMAFRGPRSKEAVVPADAAPIAFDFPFAVVPDWPQGDWLDPKVILEVGNERAVTWVPLVVAAAPPPPVDPTASIPLGWGLVAAAAIALLSYVLGRRPWS